MNEEILNFEFNGNVIPFALTGNDVMINATEIIKCFPGKKINNFLRTDQTQSLIEQLKDEIISDTLKSASQLITVVKGNYKDGRPQGTWMHRKLAIAFAMWCSPAFYSWCLGKIDEIINKGYAFRDAEITKMRLENNNLNSIIQSQKPQVDYYNQILTTSEITYSTRELVKVLGLGISNVELLKRLEDKGFIYRDQSRKKWFLKSPYDKLGYIKFLPFHVINNKTGKVFIKNKPMWTELGKHWVWSLKQFLNI